VLASPNLAWRRAMHATALAEVIIVGATPSALALRPARRVCFSHAVSRPDGLQKLLPRAFAAIDGVLAAGAALYLAHPAGPQSVTFLEAFCAQGWSLRQTLVWVKDSLVLGHADYHFRHEPLLYGYKPGGGRRGRGG
ncbi:MAG: hypothetical protein M3088_06235, partial [Actinomycetota bacterium]|nr:hypothetical protein [Actinomycetota bacterium]